MTKSTKQKLEYMAEYQKKPENVEKRVDRNRARRHAIADGKAAVGDGKDIGHKVALDNGGSGADSNTKVQSRKSNRGWRKDASYKVKNTK
jgi:hypothetical protein